MDDQKEDEGFTASSPIYVRRERWYQQVSVEPVMFLYMGAIMLSTVVEQAFFVHKACTIDVGLSYEICTNITAKGNEEYNKKVQVVVSTFHQYEGIASHIVPMVLAFYLGAWSDRVGRKLPLLLGLAGNVFYWASLTLNSIQDWPLQVVLYTATFPAALTGNTLAIFMASFSYVSDISSPADRTLRVTLVEVAYLVTMPIGVAVGSYIFKNLFLQSFAKMFLLSTVVMIGAFLYALARLDWCTNETRQSTPLSCAGTVYDTVRVLTKSRPNKYSSYLKIIIFAMAVYTFQRDEKNMTFLYTQLMFHWDVATYSTFRTFQSSLYILGLLVGGPVLGKVLGLQDTVIIMIGAASHAIARVMYATWLEPTGFYVGAAIGTLGPITAPILRSITSKLVPSSERGKAMSLLSVADTSVPMISGFIYSQVYNATISTAPMSIFWVTVIAQVLVFLCGLLIHCTKGSRPLEQAIDTAEERL